MELIYSAGPATLSSKKSRATPKIERLLGSENICRISSRNVLAFSASGGPEDGLDVTSRGYHLFVTDLNTPWDIKLVHSGGSPVSCLEWDTAGSRLLAGHSDGLLQLFESRERLFNSWTCLHSARLDNEEIVQVLFFHNGKKISISAEKKDSVLYNEKFQNSLFSPTLRHFGGRPTDGFIGLTATGLLAVCTLTGNGLEASFKRYELTSRRSFIRLASMVYSKNGSVLVACSCGLPDAPVSCHQVSLRYTGTDTVNVTMEQLPSIYMEVGSQHDSGMLAVTSLQHLNREDGSCVLVSAAGESGSVLEMWQLGEITVNLNKMLKRPSNGSEPRVQTWLKCGSYKTHRPVATVDTSRVCLENGGLPASPVLLAMADGALISLHRDSLTQLSSTSVQCGVRPPPDGCGEPPLKMARPAPADPTSVRVTDLALSCAGHVAAAVDDHGQIYVYRVSWQPDSAGVVMPSTLVTQLEYYMVTGLDVWDLLVGLRPHLSAPDAICDTLSDTFHRQPGPVQQFYYMRHMAIKTSLYRMYPAAGGRKLADNSALLMLRCVASSFRALLRPSEPSPMTAEPEPSDPFNALMSSKPVEGVLEIDKVLSHLKDRDPGAVDVNSLVQVQHLVQWVADLCLHLLTSLTDTRLQKQVGALRDRQSLLLLRELVVMIRRWGMVRSACLPVFQRHHTEQSDVIATTFRLLTKLLAVHYSTEPDETLLNECSLLPPPLLVEHSPLDLPSRGILAIHGSSSSAKHYEYYDGESAESQVTHRRQQDSYAVDSLRHLRLGVKPGCLKQCTRCMALTSCKSAQQLSQMKVTPVTRSWDQRWVRSCLCGGNWSLQTTG